jgi:putative ABC transport system permease protein
MVESGVISAAGGALGLLLAFGGIKLLVALRPANLPRLDTVGIDGSVLGFTAIAAVLSAFLFGLIPAFQASQPKISQVLKDRGRSAMHKGHRVFRNTLVVAQVALSVMLLIGAGLMIRSFRAQQRVELGYQPAGVLTFNLQLPGNRYPPPQRQEFFRTFTDRLRALPGVTHVSAATPIPLLDTQSTGRYGPPEALGDETRYGQADYRFVFPGYFETMGTRLLEGRLFDEADFRDSAQVVLIDRKLASILWPGRSAVGERMLIRANTLESEFVQVIGVVEHQRSHGVAAEGPETVYLTSTYVGTPANNFWIVRSSLDPLSLIPQVRTVLAEMDQQLPISDVRTMTDRVDEAMTGARFALVLIGVFGGVALILAAVGIYGVLSYTVRQRTAEFGVRMALGADASSILRLVVRQGLTLTGIGLAVGLLAGFWATRLMGNLLVGVSPNDPVTYLTMTVLFVLAAVGASYAPARRATLVDPVVALREEGE